MNPADLQSRIQLLLDDEMSAEEFAELEAELLENPEALATYQTWVNLHCGLQSRGAFRETVEKMPVVPVDRVIALQRRKVVRTSLLAAAAILLISAVALWMVVTPNPPVTIAGFRTAPGSAFILTHTGDGEPPMGKVLAEGSRIVLEHGAAELALPHAVHAVVESPAVMTLLDDRTLQLDHGRAYFQISTEDGKGFTVVTPHQRIVDLGTAFGVDARIDRDEVELHVFEGRVRVDSLDGGKGETIKAERSVLLAGNHVQRDFTGPMAPFRRKLPPRVETLLLEDFESGLVGRREYAVRIDSTAIRDLAGNCFPGIDDDLTWNFTVAAQAPYGVTVTPDHIVSGQVTGTLVAVDAPYLPTIPGSDSLPVPISSTLGPDWPETADSGWQGRAGSNLQMDDGQSPWEPDGTALDEAKGYRASGYGPAGSVSWTFDIPDGTVINAVYATWNNRRKDGITYGYAEGAASDSVVRQTGGAAPADDLVLSWTDAASDSHRGSFERIFSDPIIVEGGDGFTLWGTDNIHNAVHIDAVILDISSDSGAPISRPGDSGTAGDHMANATQQPAEPDTSPPVARSLSPRDNAIGVPPGERLTIAFNESIKFGTGRIFLRNITDWTEIEIAVGGPRTSIDGRLLTINPPTNLPDGEIRMGRIGGWQCDAGAGVFNPNGNGTRYMDEGLKDKGQGRGGTIGSMRGPVMATFGNAQPGTRIHREFASIAPDSRYTVSVAIGVRDESANQGTIFDGYTIRLVSGDTVLADLVGNTPPGPPNSVSTVGFSWDSSNLPEGLAPGAPLTLEIAPNQASGAERGYLDLDNVRVTVTAR